MEHFKTMQYFKSVKPDGFTRHGLDWNVPTGTIVRADHDLLPSNTGPCPKREGDGITIAKTFAGAALAGWPTQRCCAVTFDRLDVLGEDQDKIRVRAVRVGEWFDAIDLLRKGYGAGANLSRAYLSGADLSRADLSGADLYGANLSGANLSEWERAPGGTARRL